MATISSFIPNPKTLAIGLFICASINTVTSHAFAHTCPEFTDASNAEIYQFPIPQGTANSHWVYQEFHHNGEPQRNSVSGWRILLRERKAEASKWTLAIDQAWYTTSEGREIKVLGGLWPAQIIVPYAQEKYVPEDLFWGSKLTPMDNAHLTWECSDFGPDYETPHTNTDDPYYGAQRPIFIKELHDYGVSEMTIHDPDGPLYRRGTELVIWANSDAGNYDNYIKYHFRDDGQILAYLGTSGWNSADLLADFADDEDNFQPTGTAVNGWVPHLHSALWRVHPKIGDWRHNDKVYKISFNQNLSAHGGREKLNKDQIKQELDLNDEADEYISILFEDEETNFGRPMGYAINRISGGATRHRINETGNLLQNIPNQIPNDFYLRKYHASELELQFIGTSDPNGAGGDKLHLTKTAQPKEWIDQGGAVLFATTSVKHIPRNEDFVARPMREYPAYAIVTQLEDNPNTFIKTTTVTNYATTPPSTTTTTEPEHRLNPNHPDYDAQYQAQDERDVAYATHSAHYNSYYSKRAEERNRNKISWHGLSLMPRNIYRRTPFSADKPCIGCPPLEVNHDKSATGEKSHWTNWMNRDSASGSGDFETLRDFQKQGLICTDVIDVECRTIKDQRASIDTGQVYSCQLPEGGICWNKQQSDGRCRDFEVRFLCAQ